MHSERYFAADTDVHPNLMGRKLWDLHEAIMSNQPEEVSRVMSEILAEFALVPQPEEYQQYRIDEAAIAAKNARVAPPVISTKGDLSAYRWAKDTERLERLIARRDALVRDGGSEHDIEQQCIARLSHLDGPV